MPEPKEKSENYFNFGGVDRKSSPYITPKNNFLTLENVDFRIIGSLCSTPGTTQFTSVGTSSSITGIADYYSVGNTYGYGFATYTLVATDQRAAYNITGGTFLSIYDFYFPGNPTPFTFSKNQYLYGTNGWEFFAYPGATTAWQYGMPAPYFGAFSFHTTTNLSGFSGTIAWYFSYVRSDGLYGPPIGQTLNITGLFDAATSIIFSMPRLNPAIGVSYGSFGISGVQLWYSLNGSTPRGYGSLVSPTATTFIIQSQSSTLANGWFITSVQPPEEYVGTFLYGLNSGSGASAISLVTGYNPAALAVFNNQLFAGGFQLAQDDLWYSQIGKLEMHDLEGFFSVRANDGDIISCLANYFTQLIIFKVNSITALSGTDPDNFFLTEVNNQYGCLAPNAYAIWEQNLWFLDKKGVCLYNGANTKCVSDPMEDYFLRMNVPAARIHAIMLHVKERNEVWCAIPIDGSDYNNIIIIYDYVSQAWRTRSLDRGTAINTLTRGINKQTVFMGNYSGMIYTYGHSLTTDNGIAFTSVIKSRFISDLGHSVEKQFRRLFLDAKVPAGQTYVFPVNFYTDQGVSPALQTTMVLSEFQDRIDFGLPGKDLAFELFYSQGQFLQINGFTIEYRFQRAV